VQAIARQDSKVVAESFIGTLNIDDFASLVISQDITGQNIDVEIRFRDSNNGQHVVEKTLEAGKAVYSAQQGTRGTGISGQARNNTSAQMRSPFGFLLGPGGNTSSSSGGGVNLLLIGGAVVVVAVAGYFAYRKFIAGKKKHAANQAQGGRQNEK